MDSQILIAIQITVVGMGLVFGAILLLWGLMALIVRLAAEPTTSQASLEARDQARKEAAAAAAVSLALARSDENEPHPFPLPPTAIVSAWQAVMRTKMLNKRGQIR